MSDLPSLPSVSFPSLSPSSSASSSPSSLLSSPPEAEIMARQLQLTLAPLISKLKVQQKTVTKTPKNILKIKDDDDDNDNDTNDDHKMMSPLFDAITTGIKKKVISCVEELKTKGLLNVRQVHHTPLGLTVFHACVKTSALQILKWLIKNCSEILQDVRTPTTLDNCTPLNSACANNDDVMVNLLLSLDGVSKDIHLPCNDGTTPLMSAANCGNTRIGRLLGTNSRIPTRVLVNATDSNGETSMLRAIKEGHYAMVKLLVAFDDGKEKSIIHTPSKSGWTPVLLAAATNHDNILRFLYQNGCQSDINIPNKAGLTPMRYALAAGHTHQTIVRMLQRWKVPLMSCTQARLGYFHTADGHRGETLEDGKVQHQFMEM